MNLHDDFSLRCVVDSHFLPWTDSPSPLVKRGLLERNGAEPVRATSMRTTVPGWCRLILVKAGHLLHAG